MYFVCFVVNSLRFSSSKMGRLTLRFLASAFLASALAGSFANAQSPAFDAPLSHPEDIQKFFADYCIACHGPKKQKGERRLDGLTFPVEDLDTLLTVQEVIDVLTLGDMPPEDAKVRPPDSSIPRSTISPHSPPPATPTSPAPAAKPSSGASTVGNTSIQSVICSG